jgi:hypothetical protein
MPSNIRLSFTVGRLAAAAPLAATLILGCAEKPTREQVVVQQSALSEASPDPYSLGGVLIGGPAAASWGDGRVDVFVRGTDDGIYHNFFNGSAWSGYIRFPAPWATNEEPAAVSWGPERIDVALRGTNGLVYHLWCQGRATCESTGYGIDEHGTPPGVSVASAPAIVSQELGKLDIFVLGSDGRFWQKSWTGSAWTGWTVIPDGTLTSRPAAASLRLGRIDLFGRGVDMALYHNVFDGGVWSGWTSLGGDLVDGPAASTEDGAVVVFARGATPEGALLRGTLSPVWSGFELLYTGIDSSPTSVAYSSPDATIVLARRPGTGDLIEVTGPDIGEPMAAPFRAVDHAAGGDVAVRKVSCTNYLVNDLQMVDKPAAGKMNYAEAWTNDPDCFGDSCDFLSVHDLEKLNVYACWACRNPDHFTVNEAFSARPYPTEPLPFDPFSGIRSSRTQGYRNNAEAIKMLKEYAIEKTKSQYVDDQKKAVRAALRACHYAMDALACGHGVGNRVCDPAAMSLTPSCEKFVDDNRGKLTFENQGIVAGTLRVCAGSSVFGVISPTCDVRLSTNGYDWMDPNNDARNKALAYAAAERLIRHYSAGAVLREPNGSDWRNSCHESCTDGECLAGQPRNPLGSSDQRLLENVCIRIIEDTICANRPKKQVSRKVCTCPGAGCGVVNQCRDAQAGETGYDDCATAQAHTPPANVFCCGDGICDGAAGENCGTCARDCRCCGNGRIDPGEQCDPAGGAATACGGGATCTSSCTCEVPPVCGDGKCNGGETESSCCADCGCSKPGFFCEGIGKKCVCEETLVGECGTVPSVCKGTHTFAGCRYSYQQCVNNWCTPPCGDGKCEGGENCSDCLADCPCGTNQTCVAGRCEESTCCSGRVCGTDPCNPTLSCGTCQPPFTCDEGPGLCICNGNQDCTGKCGPQIDQCGNRYNCPPCSCCGSRNCGPDPCNPANSCGTCQPNFTCDSSGICGCVDFQDCSGKCGTQTDRCGNRYECEPCSCCGSRNCGPDPCNPAKSCGTCQANFTCDSSGICGCVDFPDCSGGKCGTQTDRCGNRYECEPCGPVCGDSVCEAGESCSSCQWDCGSCGPVCGNFLCEAGESCNSCDWDCGSCGPVCGNFWCEAGESCSSCDWDCGSCGPVCGDGWCDWQESCASCSWDCGTCGGGGGGQCGTDSDCMWGYCWFGQCMYF